MSYDRERARQAVCLFDRETRARAERKACRAPPAGIERGETWRLTRRARDVSPPVARGTCGDCVEIVHTSGVYSTRALPQKDTVTLPLPL